eukprot:g7712.t1
MIVYDKRHWGLPLLFRIYGSAFPRCLPFAILSGTITLVLELTVGKAANFEDESEARSWWRHPYPFQTYAFIVGFMLVFRSNFGYSRFWEARTNLQLMTTKWTDAAIQCVKFDFCTLPGTLSEEARQNSQIFQDNIIHLISLLHGVALQNLRRDFETRNLHTHNSRLPMPPMDAYYLKGTAPGESGWFSWKDILKLGSSSETRAKYCHLLPIYVVHGVTSEELVSLGWTVTFEGGPLHERRVLDVGLDVPKDTDRVQTVMSWIHQLIIERRRQGGLNVEPPILTRVYQVLSEGMQGFEQCRKIADTPFPFPWAQFVAACLLSYALTVPIVISSFVTAPLLAVVLDVISVVTYYALNEVARDLEDPFIYDPNDLPLATYQYEFNERLMIIQKTKKPRTPAEERHNKRGQDCPPSLFRSSEEHNEGFSSHGGDVGLVDIGNGRLLKGVTSI